MSKFQKLSYFSVPICWLLQYLTSTQTFSFLLGVGVGGGGGGGGGVGRIGQWSEGAIALLRPCKFLNSEYQ